MASDPAVRPRPRGPVPPDLVPPQRGSPTDAGAQPRLAPGPSKSTVDLTRREQSGDNPVDLDSLHQKGIISDEEYDQLRNFFEEKKSGGAT